MTLAVTAVAVALLVNAAVVAAIGVRLTTSLTTAVRETVAGIYERGERPDLDYALFDEELARIHLEQAEEGISWSGELVLEYDPKQGDEDLY